MRVSHVVIAFLAVVWVVAIWAMNADLQRQPRPDQQAVTFQALQREIAALHIENAQLRAQLEAMDDSEAGRREEPPGDRGGERLP